MVDQRLLNFLMQDEKPVSIYLLLLVLERPGHVTINVDRSAVLALAGEVRDVVGPVDLFDTTHDGVEGAVHHQVRNEPVGDM